MYKSFDKSLTFPLSHATLYCKSSRFIHIKPLFDFIFRPAATPNYFAAIHLRQNPLAPAKRIFYFLIDLQPDHRPAILAMYLESFISRLNEILRHDLTFSVGEPDNAAAQTGAGTAFGANGDPHT